MSNPLVLTANAADFLTDVNGSKKQKGAVKRELILSEDMGVMASKIIINKRLDVYPAKIGYALAYPNISKTMAGKCIKTNKELKFFSGLDYVIEMSGELWDALDEETRAILLEHELRHILILQNDNSGEWAFKLKRHDIQDFGRIAEEHGTDWIKKVRLSLSAIYGLTPAEEDNIQL